MCAFTLVSDLPSFSCATPRDACVQAQELRHEGRGRACHVVLVSGRVPLYQQYLSLASHSLEGYGLCVKSADSLLHSQR